MASKLDIFNMALPIIGITTEVASLTESSVPREILSRYYDTARQAVLRAECDWSFARRYATLVAETTDDPPGQWAYIYDLPSGYLQARWIVPSESGGYLTRVIPFEIVPTASATHLCTNEPDAVFRHTIDVTDEAEFDATFVLCFAARLAHMVAAPLSRDRGVAERAFGEYQLQLALAQSANGSEFPSPYNAEQAASSIQARGLS